MSEHRRVTMPSPVKRGKDGDLNVNWYDTEGVATDAAQLLAHLGLLDGAGAAGRPDLDAGGLFAVAS